jgi:hypothetical protein
MWIESAYATTRQIQRGDTVWLQFTKPNNPPVERRYVLHGMWAVAIVDGRESWVPVGFVLASRREAERWLEVDSLRALAGPPR